MGSKIHKGQSNPRSKLTEEIVREIRIKSEIPSGESPLELARYYGVSVVTIYKILSGERWGHVK